MMRRTWPNCGRSSGGIDGLWALYSVYWSCLKVGPLGSKAMAQWVGFQSSRYRRKVFMKP